MRQMNFMFGIAVIVGAFLVGGCRPYNAPQYTEISPNETAFMIPLEGDSMNQDSFESVEYLKQNKVAARRVQIPRRWIQTGRMYWSGRYVDTARVIRVDRAPKTRSWTVANEQAIYVESRDSIGFSVDITLVAQIHPDDVPQFLYIYPTSESGSEESKLDRVLDTEVRAAVQDQLARYCAQYNMEELRSQKNEMMDAVRSQVVPYFKTRGISIPTIGMGSGLAYESRQIQDAINRVVEAQQDQDTALAEQQAHQIRNQTDVQRAEAQRQVAQIQADARKYELEQATQSGPGYIQLLQIQAFLKWIEKWDGRQPNVQMSSGDGVTPLIQIPTSNAP